MPRTTPLVRVEAVTLDLSGRRILEDVTLEVGEGEFLGLIGPNGGGKTTLLRVLLGVLRPSSGEVTWACGAEGRSPHIGYVPQKGGLDRCYPMSCREIVEQGRLGAWPLWGERARHLRERANELLERVGMSEHSDRPFADLSGGQQRRCLLARSLVDSPSVLLLDEPTAGVDRDGQGIFCSILRDLTKQGVAVVLVSHDFPLVTRHAHRIACLGGSLHWHGPARALEQRTIERAYRCELERYRVEDRGQEKWRSEEVRVGARMVGGGEE